MKTVKILIATVILCTSFYACKKDEMNIKSEDAKYQSSSANKLSSESTFDATGGMIKIVFNKVGTMIIEGNPNLEKLISMYDASNTAIAAAKEVLNITQQEQLSIVFNRDGYAVASDIPKVLVGSNIEHFMLDFCKIKLSKAMSLEISKDDLKRNNQEYWDALPAGLNERFLADVKNFQSELPIGYSLQLSFSENQAPSVIYLDENGNPQPIGNGQTDCTDQSESGVINSIGCFFQTFIGWM